MALFNARSFQRLAKDLVDLVEEGEDLLAEDRLLSLMLVTVCSLYVHLRSINYLYHPVSY